jgi:5-oxoprolinase (ATP-hydrolysing)
LCVFVRRFTGIGGATPSSFRRFSTRGIEEEGIKINNLFCWCKGVLREAEMVAPAGSGEYRLRNPAQNLADLKARIAANEKACRNCARWSNSSA